MASATVAGLGDHLEAVAPVEERDQALPDDLVVVDDQEAKWIGGVVWPLVGHEGVSGEANG